MSEEKVGEKRLYEISDREIIEEVKRRKLNLWKCYSCQAFSEVALKEVHDRENNEWYWDCSKCCWQCYCGEMVNDSTNYLHEYCEAGYCEKCGRIGTEDTRKCEDCLYDQCILCYGFAKEGENCQDCKSLSYKSKP
jgi:hypothetical protein